MILKAVRAGSKSATVVQADVGSQEKQERSGLQPLPNDIPARYLGARKRGRAEATVNESRSRQVTCWPYTGKVTQCGAGAGAGCIINLPLPGGCGHEAMRQVLSEVVWPAARRHQPELVLVSAGYDAHWRDPLAGLQFESRTYHHLFGELARLAAELCGGRCMFVLEGGYHAPSLGEAVADSFLGVLGQPALEPTDAPRGLQPEPSAKLPALLSQARRLHRLD